ncbi:MAG: 3-hydroxyacyl-CoA dehydrogenase [Alphaproteobacteria bacterium]|nr:3-hydroxyacyl-CoA dehydrogenase [Alphaproteobacteria bacterium]
MQGNKGVVIGGGTMGTHIASIFVANGHDAEIVEPDEAARENLEAGVIAAAHEIGLGKSLGNVRVVASIDHIDWSDAYLLIECVPETLSLKQEVFAQLDKTAPRHLPLTSNSSGFPISRIADNLETADRMVGLHFFMPAHLVPCVEVIVGERSDLSVVDDVHAMMDQLGKKPVRVNKDIPGFLGNRIQGALMREALALVDGGYATFEDIDTVVQYSFGFRFVAAGPLLQKDVSGIQTLFASQSTIFPTLDNSTEPGPTIQRLQAEEKFGMRSKEGFYRWDDEKIAATKARYNRDLQSALDILRDQDI